jgi:hypothetical protein
MTREDQAAPVLRLGTDRDDQIRLPAVGGWVALDADAGRVEVVGEEIGERGVAGVARGVERDQAGQQLTVVEMPAGRAQVPGSVARRAMRARTSRTPGCSSGSASFQRSTNRR